jgi:hypothetical protein
MVVLFLAIFFLFARTPYLCGTNRVSLWVVSAMAGLPQLWLVYSMIHWAFYPEWFLVTPDRLRAAGCQRAVVSR